MKAKNGAVARWVRRVLFGLAVIVVAVLAIRAARPKPLTVERAENRAREPAGDGHRQREDPREGPLRAVGAPRRRHAPPRAAPRRRGGGRQCAARHRAVRASAPSTTAAAPRPPPSSPPPTPPSRSPTRGIELAKTTIAAAQKDYDRIKSLYDKSAATQVELEGVDFKLRSAKSDLESAKFSGQVSAYEAQVAALAVAQVGEKPGTGFAAILKTPVTGSVLRVYQESAGLVAPGTPLLEVGDLSRMEIVVDLLSTEAVRVKPGADAAISHWGGAGELLARVRKVEPSGFAIVGATASRSSA